MFKNILLTLNYRQGPTGKHNQSRQSGIGTRNRTFKRGSDITTIGRTYALISFGQIHSTAYISFQTIHYLPFNKLFTNVVEIKLEEPLLFLQICIFEHTFMKCMGLEPGAVG